MYGRQGDGPGEFRGPAVLRVLNGDSVFVYDEVRQVAMVWDSLGRLAREFAVPAGEMECCFSDGGFVVKPRRAGLQAPSANPTVGLLAFDREGRVLDTLLTFVTVQGSISAIRMSSPLWQYSRSRGTS